MASSRLTRLVPVAMAFVLASGAIHAQTATRVRGTIVAADGNVVAVRVGSANTAEVTLGEKTEIVYTQPIALSDIKPGDFLGVTSMKRPDGTLVAYEVRRFPKPLNPGHRPFDGRDDQTMTNATVSASVQVLNGRELTLIYEGGAQKILVSENAVVSMLVPGNRAQLVRGARVNLTHDANRVALRIQVGPPKP